VTSGNIPRELVEEILSRTDIVEVVSQSVQLKKSGRNFLGLCPFHHEKTPSFSVSPEKQIFHCFGCQTGGNALTFLMKREGLSFLDALQKLAEYSGISLPEKESSPYEQAERKKREKIAEVNELAISFYRQYLLKSKEGETARKYLLSRGIKEEAWERFELGYAPDEWQALGDYLAEKKYSGELLLAAGLVGTNSQGKKFDRFRSRIMFPIRDLKGKAIGFGGRLLKEDKLSAKYLNSPDTLLFNKGKQLYALNLARRAIFSEGNAILVEGYMDVIACHQAGIENAVASLGTALTEEQAKLLLRSTRNIRISYDSDAAGEKAADKAIDILRNVGVHPGVVVLPPGQDPDDILRKKGKDGFLEYVNQARTALEYKLGRAKKDVSLSSIEGRIKVVKNMLPYYQGLRGSIEKESFFQTLAKELSISENSIREEIKKLSGRVKKEENNEETQAKPELSAVEKLEMKLLKLLFEENDYFAEVEAGGGESLFSEERREIYLHFWEEYCQKGKLTGVNSAFLINETVETILAQPFFFGDNPERAATDLICNIRLQRIDEKYRKILMDLNSNGEKEKQLLLQELTACLYEKEQIKNTFNPGRGGRTNEG